MMENMRTRDIKCTQVRMNPHFDVSFQQRVFERNSADLLYDTRAFLLFTFCRRHDSNLISVFFFYYFGTFA